MAIVATQTGGDGKKYLHPEGQFAAVCIDVIDLGYVKSNFNGNEKVQHKIVIRFWAGERNTDGDPLYVGDRFTLSLYERARLRPFLEAWRGKKFTDKELQGFDVETLIGVPAYLQVSHTERNGKTYSNVASVMRLPKGEEPPVPLSGYIRVCDRTTEEQTQEKTPFAPEDSDDLPF